MNNNLIKDFKELFKIKSLPNLSAIYVEKNQFCSEIPTYTAKIKHLLPHLTQIDAELISGSP